MSLVLPKDLETSSQASPENAVDPCPAFPASCSNEERLSPTLSAPLCDCERWMACEGEAIWSHVDNKSTVNACTYHAGEYPEEIWHPAWMIGCRWHAVVCEDGPLASEGQLPFRCSYAPLTPSQEQDLRVSFRKRECFWNYEVRAAEMFSTIDLLRERLDKISALATQLVQSCGSHGGYSALVSMMATEKLIALLKIRKLTGHELLDMSIACSEEHLTALANEASEAEDRSIPSPPPSR